MRDIEHAYREAMVAEYEDLVRASRTEEAAHVAEALRERYSYEVRPKAEPEKQPKAPEPERADLPRPPEVAVEPKAGPRSARAAKKAASPSDAGK